MTDAKRLKAIEKRCEEVLAEVKKHAEHIEGLYQKMEKLARQMEHQADEIIGDNRREIKKEMLKLAKKAAKKAAKKSLAISQIKQKMGSED
ncbi:hypothetical protein ACFODZ_08880 [Marinicella sediminis]|uniref:Uncharacterized protein n=1 Tax=Marinicella sediminis TaxID=1792834 RepID=A0ABV7JCE7_9GAMM|nr:hypothetical protein [Marinicella sediminis]